MKLTNAYIIDGDVIEKRLKELEELKDSYVQGTIMYLVYDTTINYMNTIKEQHLKPALPIVEEIFDKASVYTKHSRMGADEFDEVGICKFREQFLTKDF